MGVGLLQRRLSSFMWFKFLICLAALALTIVPASAQKKRPRTNSLAPYVPSPQVIVDKMLEAAEVKAGEVVYDLGSGDGRVLITAAQKYKAKGVGVELSEDLVKTANQNVIRAGLENQIKIIHGNMLDVDVSPADVIIMYLLTHSNDLIRPTLERQLKPGTRVVSHDYQIRGWTPAKVETVDAHGRPHNVYVYRMPSRK